jgi:hypothetical protein
MGSAQEVSKGAAGASTSLFVISGNDSTTPRARTRPTIADDRLRKHTALFNRQGEATLIAPAVVLENGQAVSAASNRPLLFAPELRECVLGWAW